MCQMRRNLEADVTIQPVGGEVDGAQHVAGIAHIGGDERLVDLTRVVPRLQQFFDPAVVIAAAGDRLPENGRLGSHAAQAVFGGASLQLAIGDHGAREVVEPVALAMLFEFQQGIHGIYLRGVRTGRAAGTTLCIVALLFRCARRMQTPCGDGADDQQYAAGYLVMNETLKGRHDFLELSLERGSRHFRIASFVFVVHIDG